MHDPQYIAVHDQVYLIRRESAFDQRIAQYRHLVRSVELQVAACTIKVADGMKITYLSPELDQLRATNLQLILSRHPADCVTCFKNQKCELQKLAARFDMTERTYIKADLTYNKDHSNPLIIVDDRYCIGCQRCIRACKKINGSNIICMAGRGIKSHITFYEDEETLKEKCSKCMKCVEVCPVAALRENK